MSFFACCFVKGFVVIIVTDQYLLQTKFKIKLFSYEEPNIEFEVCGPEDHLSLDINYPPKDDDVNVHTEYTKRYHYSKSHMKQNYKCKVQNIPTMY